MYSHKSNTALQFSDLRQLWSFAQKVSTKNLEIHTNTKTLVCECSAEDINLAVTGYGAKITEGSTLKATSSFQS